MEKLSGKRLANFADEQLFQPLGINNYKWEHSKDGVTYGVFGLHLVPRDFEKLGQLLLQNGVWNGEQLIHPAYLNQALSHQVNIDLNDQSYGYYFWLNLTQGTFEANGHGGQYLFVAPDKNLVVVYTAWPYTNGNLQGEAKQLIQRVYNACY